MDRENFRLVIITPSEHLFPPRPELTASTIPNSPTPVTQTSGKPSRKIHEPTGLPLSPPHLLARFRMNNSPVEPAPSFSRKATNFYGNMARGISRRKSNAT